MQKLYLLLLFSLTSFARPPLVAAKKAGFLIIQSLKDVNPMIGNLPILAKAMKELKDVPGIHSKRGPISIITRFGTTHSSSGQFNNAKGAAYELETAYRLTNEGHTILAFNQRIENTEFDIITNKLCVECKNIKWQCSNENERVKKQLQLQAFIALRNRLPYILYSKNAITASWKQWLQQRNIAYKDN